MKIDLGLSQSEKKIGKVKKQNIEIEEPSRKSSSLEFTSLMDMLTKFGKAFYLFSTYNCQEAINMFQLFPENHQLSG